MIRFFYIGTLLMFSGVLKAQNICTQTLREARTVYDEGRLQELEPLLSSCLENGFTREEKVEAYRLLILSYIYLDEPDKADETMLKLLKTEPLYTVNRAVDPEELINLYNSFRTWPILRAGIRLGANATIPNVIAANGVSNYNNGGSRGEYEYLIGFSGVLQAEILLSSKLSVSTEFVFSNMVFDYDNEQLIVNPDGSIVTQNMLIERQSWGQLHVMGSYTFTLNKLNPYISLGGAVGYNFYTESTNEREIFGQQPVRANTTQLERSQIGYFAVGSVGVKRAFKRGYFIFDTRFIYGLNDTSNAENIVQDNPEYIFNYYGPYNEFSLNSLMLTIGYQHNIFKPKKLDKDR